MAEPHQPSRRDVMFSSASAACATVLPGIANAAAAASKRPNIVWVVCHDVFAGLIGTYGNKLAKTPAIDGLAQQGIRFDNAFSVAPVCAPSRFALVTGMYPDSCGPADHMRGIGHIPPGFTSLPEMMRAAGYYATNNVFTDYNCDLDPGKIWDECSITAHWRNRPADKPFFCVYNYMITHESRVIDFEGELDTDPAQVEVPPFLPDLPEIRRAIAQNVDIVNRQDAALAKLLGDLDADGLADDTIVFFMADHGGVFPRSKRYCYEEGARIPVIVRIPETFAHLRADYTAGRSTSRVISNVDMAPTVLSLAGVAQPVHMAGFPFLGTGTRPREVAFTMRNRMDERYDIVRAARDERYRYIRNYSPHRIYGLHNAYEWQLTGYQVWEKAHLAGTLNPVQSRFWQEKPREELYDIQNDPHQLVNLAKDPAHRSRRDVLSKALDEHMLATNDNGFIPEDSGIEGYWPSRQPGAFPIRQVLSLANKAIDRDPRNAPVFVEALRDDNVCVRFWAAQGLLMMKDRPTRLRKALTGLLAQENSPHVRCALAEALGMAGDAAGAVNALAEVLCTNESKRVKLLALEGLTYLPVEAVRAARDDIVKSSETDEYTLDAATYLKLRIDGTYTPASKTFILQMPNGGGALMKRIGDPQI